MRQFPDDSNVPHMPIDGISIGSTEHDNNFLCQCEIWSANSPLLTHAYYTYHAIPVRQEIRTASITNKDRVLSIGGGGIPHTAIRIAAETGAHVDVVERHEAALRSANSVVERFGLSDKVSLYYANAVDFSVIDYDVIFVALHVHPIRQIIKMVLQRAKPGTRIVTRSTWAESKLHQNALVIYYNIDPVAALMRRPWWFYNSFISKKSFIPSTEVMMKDRDEN